MIAPSVFLAASATAAFACGSGTEPSFTAWRLAFLTQPGVGEGQVAFDPPVRVALVDSLGDVLPDTMTLTMSLLLNSVDARLVGTTAVRAVDGIATFADLGVDRAGTGYVLEAASPRSRLVRSDAFSVRTTMLSGTSTTGQFHTCAITAQGFAYCWGLNGFGQLGDGTNSGLATPVPVVGRRRFAQLSAGASHTCGLLEDGAAYCWGEVGNSGTTAGPEAVAGSLRFRQLGTYWFSPDASTCAVTLNGEGYCWGRSLTPAPLAGNLVLAEVSVGALHACAVTVDSLAYCWGANSRGQLGDGTTDERQSPVPVADGLEFLHVAAGFEHTCGIAANRAAYCWGANNEGQLGDGTIDPRLTPTPVAGDLSFLALSASGIYTCGATIQQSAYCWGGNYDGQLGDGTGALRLTPTPVVGGLSFARVSAAVFHACGVTTGNVAYCWGWGPALGDSTGGGSPAPKRVWQ